MFKLSAGDFWRGFIVAVLGAFMVAVFGVLNAVISAPNFDVFEVAWLQVFKDLTNAVIIAVYASGSSYLLKNLLTDSNKNFLGIKTKS